MVHIKNVEEIIKISESHETPNLLACKYIRKNVDNLIRSRAVNHKYITFEIPAMIVSNPHYDRERVTKKIVSHYKKLGFVCSSDEYNVNISWDIEKEDKEEEEEESDEDDDEELDDDSDNPRDEDSDEEENKETRKIVLKNPTSLQIRVRDLKGK